MACRRAFSPDVIETDWFTNMGASAQLLYIHLCMGADNDGFVTNIKVAKANAHASDDDLQVLIAKKFIIKVEDGLCLVKHWLQNNQLKYTNTSPFADRLVRFSVKKDGSYTDYTEALPCAFGGKPKGRGGSGSRGRSRSRSRSNNEDLDLSSQEGNTNQLSNYSTDYVTDNLYTAFLIKSGYITEDEPKKSNFNFLLGRFSEKYGGSETIMLLGQFAKNLEEHDCSQPVNKLAYLRESMERIAKSLELPIRPDYKEVNDETYEDYPPED